ncbi:MAG TPA: hypothetical protein DCE56_02530 [Cyanobacteria bacterium UBA8553]|nr:hypothetical protein [Cyanobacteria bacterium UBA8553]
MFISTCASVYSDELITATELNRQPGRVLDRALERPVTITRNDQHFALLRRDDVTWLTKAARQMSAVFEVMSVAYRLRLGEEISAEHPYGWLKVFDTEELSELLTEIENTYRLVGSGAEAWDNLDVVIHEWRESAIAIQSQELATAFSDEIDEVLLTEPTTETTTD